jgi:hypothetical protein
VEGFSQNKAGQWLQNVAEFAQRAGNVLFGRAGDLAQSYNIIATQQDLAFRSQGLASWGAEVVKFPTRRGSAFADRVERVRNLDPNTTDLETLFTGEVNLLVNAWLISDSPDIGNLPDGDNDYLDTLSQKCFGISFEDLMAQERMPTKEDARGRWTMAVQGLNQSPGMES